LQSIPNLKHHERTFLLHMSSEPPSHGLTEKQARWLDCLSKRLTPTRHALPAIYNVREFAEVGGLITYGTSLTEVNRQLAVYTGDILKGAKPADLPVVQASKFELVLNAQTARAVGVKISDNLLSLADEVIE
jgi:hypothetical protein